MVDYRIRNQDGFTEKVGELVSMLEHTRAVTWDEIQDLTQSDLDFLVDTSANTIGALLLHIASIEFVHQIISNEKRDLTETEFSKWGAALELGDKAREVINKQSLDYYLNQLSEVRSNTLTLLKSKNDSWLLEENKWGNDIPYNNYYLWFHVMEDEMNHRGQIRMMKRLIINKKRTN
ncbi:DinB family protein [Aquibacillus rhizosphaerae]|uniref:DinB family protein n=1 Tax=Aquibacillus rhizosphaerae TaxID=3051431 RepID=A0ABT7L1K6_9BACI|nr:DinB family protein [Aquibacillus sp. LR5S19]MDL4839723.1 DinB family protein [Aquibacillus sp. LR5S19]